MKKKFIFIYDTLWSFSFPSSYNKAHIHIWELIWRIDFDDDEDEDVDDFSSGFLSLSIQYLYVFFCI